MSESWIIVVLLVCCAILGISIYGHAPLRASTTERVEVLVEQIDQQDVTIRFPGGHQVVLDASIMCANTYPGERLEALVRIKPTRWFGNQIRIERWKRSKGKS